MDEFFDQIKDNLENRPEPTFEEGSWNDMKRRLDAKAASINGLLGWRLAAAALVLLLLSLGFNTWLLLDRKGEKNRHATGRIDSTVVEKHVILKTDTIYQTRVIRETVVEQSVSEVQVYLPEFSSKTNYSIDLLKNNNWSYTAVSGLRSTDPNTGQAHYSTVNDPMTRLLASKDQATTPGLHQLQKNADGQPYIIYDLPTAEGSFEAYDLLANHPLDNAPTFLPDSVRRSFYYIKRELTIEEDTVQLTKGSLNKYAFYPKGFQLGLSFGWAYPFGKGIKTLNGYAIEAEAVIPFSKNVEMWLTGTYLTLQFESSMINEGIGVPDIAPPDDDFVFSKAEVFQSSFQFAAGMQYKFTLGRRNNWQTYFGVGLASLRILPYEVNYEFENEALGLEWILQEDIEQRKVVGNFFILRAGWAYRISDPVYWHLRASYRQNWENKAQRIPSLLSLQTGLSYRF